ncbi:MAG: tetratricopeptide repeat protein [Synechococcaceae cyanobacterium SM2_3_1]|nr:tetratricopeptide repeat protein [Synechococcaceae cyanobacterium SM2_3_1]
MLIWMGLGGGLGILLLLLIRWGLQLQAGRKVPQCIVCNQPLLRLRRRGIDRCLSLMIPVYRFRCQNQLCQWEGLFVQPLEGSWRPSLAWRPAHQHEPKTSHAATISTSEPVFLSPAEQFYHQGMQKVKSRQFKDAIHDFSQAITLEPKLAPAYYNRGVSHYLLGNIYEAWTDFRKAIELFEAAGNLQSARRARAALQSLQPHP